MRSRLRGALFAADLVEIPMQVFAEILRVP